MKFIEGGDGHGDDPEHYPGCPPLLEYVYPEPSEARDTVCHIKLMCCPEVLLLLVAHDPHGYLCYLIRCKSFLIFYRYQASVYPQYRRDRKSTRLNSSHSQISLAV